ncbi:MAG: N-acetylmuramoyl-L-alanine amidase-like domain-containing protein [Thermodesulfovibrio sp.]
MLIKSGKINIENLLIKIKNLPTSVKITEISKYFLGIPYKKNSLIGSVSEKEQLIIDFEGVDCMTFIEYVEALRSSDTYQSFIENLKYVRYFNGVVDFKKRRHFFTDWVNLKTVKNITAHLTRNYLTVKKELNKKDAGLWIDGLDPKIRIIKYIPSEYIGKIISQLKSGDYCGFYTSQEGLDVTHVGILIVQERSIKLRHASSHKSCVLDEDFIEYSKQKEGIIIFRPKEI